MWLRSIFLKTLRDYGVAIVGWGLGIGVLTPLVFASISSLESSPEVQAGMRSLFTTMAVLGKTVAPLLGDALKLIAPILEKLGPPAQTLIKALGAGIQPVIEAAHAAYGKMGAGPGEFSSPIGIAAASKA